VELRKCFAENLIRYREQANLTPGELAARASIDQSEVVRLEHAERTPRIDTLIKLAGSLSVSPNELLDGIVWTPTITNLGGFNVSATDDD
jgi:transcriptional regulator with XRE-family HTH domain